MRTMPKDKMTVRKIIVGANLKEICWLNVLFHFTQLYKINIVCTLQQFFVSVLYQLIESVYFSSAYVKLGSRLIPLHLSPETYSSTISIKSSNPICNIKQGTFYRLMPDQFTNMGNYESVAISAVCQLANRDSSSLASVGSCQVSLKDTVLSRISVSYLPRTNRSSLMCKRISFKEHYHHFRLSLVQSLQIIWQAPSTWVEELFSLPAPS